MKLILIDGFGFVFRAYHSLPPLTTKDGQPIGAIYGFTNMLFKFLNNHSADYIAVVLDSGGKNFRHELYPAYKANRPTPPEDLIAQLPLINEVIEAFNIKVVQQSGLEADDLIASYTREAESRGVDVVIVSSDKDLMQLITESTQMYDAVKERVIDIEYVKNKYQVGPKELTDLFALIGDASDNIPGVKSVGPKTAFELIRDYGNLENIYLNFDTIPQSKRKQMLLECKGDAILSRSLVELKYTPVNDFEELKVKDVDKEKLATFLKKYNFKALLNKVADADLTEPFHSEKVVAIYRDIRNIAELGEVIEALHRSSVIAFNFEENSLEITCKEIPQVHVKIHYVQGQKDFFQFDNLDRNEIFEKLKPIFESTSIKKYCQDAKSFYKLLKGYGITLTSFDDPLIMAYSMDTVTNGQTLLQVLERYTGPHDVSSASIMELGLLLDQKIVENKCAALYSKIDRPLVKVLADMELRGVKVDEMKLNTLTSEYNGKARELEIEIFKLAGEEFNIASPKQLSHILFEKLGMPIAGGNKKSKSTGVEILDELAKQGFAIATLLLEWRRYTKLSNTYTAPLPKAINPKTGRIHTNFNMTLTTTGRLSSSTPNLQNIPIRNAEGAKIRTCFIAEPGNVLLSADYSQIELRLLAEVAGIEKLKNAFRNHQDIHTATAVEMFGVPTELVDSDLRRKAKTINFGIIYGISPFGLAERLGISRVHAKEFIDKYFERYPEIKKYMDDTMEFARANGFVKTLFNRKCVIKGIHDKNFAIRSFAERAAINAPLQGTASDIIKIAMNNLPDHLKQYLTLQIHDELLFEIPQGEVTAAQVEIKKIMEGACDFSIPMEVDISVGQTWS